jgi:rhodanese-related sulfurtransferase
MRCTVASRLEAISLGESSEEPNGTDAESPKRVLLVLVSLCLVAVGLARAANTADDVYDLDDLRVRITEDLSYAEVRHEGRPITLMRYQDPGHTVDAPYDQTARPCPPYCIQPMRMPGGVETVGELDVIAYLRRAAAGDDGVLVVDSRTPEWTAQGTIPGAINIPYTRLDPAKAEPKDVRDLLEVEFGAARRDGLWSFASAKTLVLFCNGPWCGQSPTNIKALLDLGYPPSKLKWYRGGMQAWESLGLTTVRLQDGAGGAPAGSPARR